jgi:K+/H+ antiporter YhaU regulatory subunit KhtT
VNVIAIKRKGQMSITPSTDEPLLTGDVFVLLGTNETLKRLANDNL